MKALRILAKIAEWLAILAFGFYGFLAFHIGSSGAFGAGVMAFLSIVAGLYFRFGKKLRGGVAVLLIAGLFYSQINQRDYFRSKAQMVLPRSLIQEFYLWNYSGTYWQEASESVTLKGRLEAIDRVNAEILKMPRCPYYKEGFFEQSPSRKISSAYFTFPTDKNSDRISRVEVKLIRQKHKVVMGMYDFFNSTQPLCVESLTPIEFEH